MLEELQISFIVIAISFGIIGLYFYTKAWHLWRHIDNDTLRAKAFLTKEFLHRNFIIALIVGILVAFHTVMEFNEFFGYPSILIPFEKYIESFYLFTLTATMALLVILAYYWCKLFSFTKYKIYK